MRTIVLFLFGVVALLIAVPTAGLAEGAWCAVPSGGDNCGYATMQQCLNSASGTGATCRPNGGVKATAPAAAEELKPRKKKKSG